MYYRNYDAEIYAFGKRLGEEFNAGTLKRAFVTRFAFSIFFLFLMKIVDA